MEWARSFHSMLLPGQSIKFWWACECGAASPDRAEEDEALAAAMQRYVEPNRVLTLAEVKALNGCPVWCEGRDGSGKWAFVQVGDGVCVDSDYDDWEFYCYGWTNERGWRAWTKKPSKRAMAANQWREEDGENG